MIHDHMTLTECHTASIHLDGLIQALDALDGNTTPEAFEGSGALLAVIGHHADALSSSLDRLDTAATVAALDPILPIYREWIKAHDALKARIELGDVDGPESEASRASRDAAFSRMVDMTPTSMAGIAALAHVMWSWTATYPEGTEEREDEIGQTENLILAAIWRAASGETGRPAD